jgi:DNA polymerase alpha subunit B
MFKQMPPADQPATPWAELIRNQHGKTTLDGQPMSVVAACGPYTLDDNLEYGPLNALLEEMSTLKPDILVLVSLMIR